MDHAGSTAALTALGGTPSLIHSRDYDHLLHGQNGIVKYNSLAGWFIYRFLLHGYPGAKADIIFEKKIDLQDFGIEAKLVHTPGHTAGSCSVVMSNGEALVGDLFIGGWLGGWIDPNWPTYHFFTEDKELVHRSIRKLLDMGWKNSTPAMADQLIERKWKNFWRKPQARMQSLSASRKTWITLVSSPSPYQSWYHLHSGCRIRNHQ
jgi:hypothetical protein